MEKDRTDIIDELVHDGYSIELYCNVFYALKSIGEDVSGLLDPYKDAYKLRFDIVNNQVINPSVVLLADIFETYPVDTLKMVAKILKEDYPDPEWKYLENEY